MLIPRTAILVMLAASSAFAGDFMPELRRVPDQRPQNTVRQVPVGTDADWPARRAAIRETWAGIIGPFPERVPLDAEVISTETLPDHTRTLVR